MTTNKSNGLIRQRLFHFLLILLIGGIGVQTIISCSSDSSGEEEGSSSSSVVGGTSSGGGGTSSSSGGGGIQSTSWPATQISEDFPGITIPAAYPAATTYTYNLVSSEGGYKKATVFCTAIEDPAEYNDILANAGYERINTNPVTYEMGIGNGNVVEVSFRADQSVYPYNTTITISTKTDDFVPVYTLATDLKLVYTIGELFQVAVTKVGNDFYSEHKEDGSLAAEFYLRYDNIGWTEYIRKAGEDWEETDRTAKTKRQLAALLENSTTNFDNAILSGAWYPYLLNDSKQSINLSTATGQEEVAGVLCNTFNRAANTEKWWKAVDTGIVLKTAYVYSGTQVIYETTLYETTGVTLPAGLPE